MSNKHKKLKVDYRKIWKEYHGEIPKDSNGKRYHIHHIDGNPNNNDISNLKALSAEDHFRIHESQFVLWAGSGHEFWTEEGKLRRQQAGVASGKKNYANKVGIFDPLVREQTDILHSKEWRIVSPTRGIDISVLSLNKWCVENGVSRSGMNCAYLENRPFDGYYLLKIDEDTSIEGKYKPRTHKNSRVHKIVNELGEVTEVTNLVKWCKDNDINREGLKTASYRGKFYKGFRLWFSKPKLTGETPYDEK